ncbi:uncharacterized protein LOC123398669 [Hordeum vulgare subsp. vulgare]|uniref:Predicted protein n=1 Tax=Hordeum vulgare subsp. vulgare TaxID=112509 RepID=F2CYR6_HORVV|nr:uncharacterized protein LOC123398669 [Hordeum vulgare subsp. vulgare]BAJ87987.1 predicted protein [Hordeum vulgare subsp. vulgare]
MPGAIHLPCCFALKSERHENYLRYVHEDTDETTYGQLQLNGEDAVNPFTRFDSEPSQLHEGLVHIRCRYNRKYWVPRQRGGGWWIVADAHEPEEDLDSPNCTLIKPIISVTNPKDDDAATTKPAVKVKDDDAAATEPVVRVKDDDATTEPVNVMTVRFVHAGNAQPGKDTRMTFSGDSGTAACMCVVVSDAKHEHDDGGDAFTVLNFARSPRRLPRFLVFKGHNDLYLSGVTINDTNYLQFSASDPGDPTVVHEIRYPGREGVVIVRNIHLDRYWADTQGQWILALYTPQEMQRPPVASWFTTVDVKDYFAISPYDMSGTLYFLKNVTRDDFTNCLNVDFWNRTITADARIRVEEAVLDREIYNVEYRLREARVYDTSVLTMATTAAVNDTSRENTKRLTLAYEESEMSTWDATLELKFGFQSRIRAGFPKLGLGATVNISAEFFGAYNWGETMEKTVSHEVEYEVTVPPKTKVTVSLIATRSAVDVPFNYRQRDIMSTDGGARDVAMTDGLYTGINSYNFKFQTTEEKLKARRLAPTPP